MSSRSEIWEDVGPASGFKRNRGRRVVIGEVPVAIYRTKERWVAIDDTCPHMGASLADGIVLGETIQCPWHEWRYHVETGQCPLRPWARVRVHEIRVEKGRVLVRRPEPAATPAEPPPDTEEWETWDPERYFKKKKP